MEDLIGGIIMFLIFLGLSIPIIVIGLIYYLKKRLEHKQIMAAIEKGTPLSELRPVKSKPTGPGWIKSFTIGIALLLISLPFLFRFLEPLLRRSYISEATLMPFGILFAIGLAFFIRGLLLRKAQRQIHPAPRRGGIQPSDKTNAAEDKPAPPLPEGRGPAGVSTAETSQQTNE